MDLESTLNWLQEVDAWVTTEIENESCYVERLRKNKSTMTRLLRIKTDHEAQRELVTNLVEIQPSQLKPSDPIAPASQLSTPEKIDDSEKDPSDCGLLPQKLDEILALAQQTRTLKGRNLSAVGTSSNSATSETSSRQSANRKSAVGNPTSQKSSLGAAASSTKTVPDGNTIAAKAKAKYHLMGQPTPPSASLASATATPRSAQTNATQLPAPPQSARVSDVKPLAAFASQKQQQELPSGRMHVDQVQVDVSHSNKSILEVHRFEEQVAHLGRFRISHRYRTNPRGPNGSPAVSTLCKLQLSFLSRSSICLPWLGEVGTLSGTLPAEQRDAFNRTLFTLVNAFRSDILEVEGIILLVRQDLTKLKQSLSKVTATKRLTMAVAKDFIYAWLRIRFWQDFIVSADSSSALPVLDRSSSSGRKRSWDIIDWAADESIRRYLASSKSDLSSIQNLITKCLYQEMLDQFICSSENVGVLRSRSTCGTPHSRQQANSYVETFKDSADWQEYLRTFRLLNTLLGGTSYSACTFLLK